MKQKNALVVILPQYADWELAPVASVIAGEKPWQVKIVAPTLAPVKSFGQVTTLPDYDVKTALTLDYDALILIGGNAWRSEIAATIRPLVEDARQKQVPIGGICDATVFLGKCGVLNTVKHTSNMLPDLQNYCGTAYAGSELYQNVSAVSDSGIVTANGTAAMDFAKALLVTLQIMTEDEADKWYRLFKLGFYDAPDAGMWWFARLAGQKNN